jgi:hypothetical protein
MSPLLAETAAQSTKFVVDLPAPYIAAGFVLLGLSVLVSLAAGASTVWNNIRPRPSASSALKKLSDNVAETYATKQDLKDNCARLSFEIERSRKDRSDEMQAVRSDITGLRAMVNQGFTELQRALGRVEGKISNE